MIGFYAMLQAIRRLCVTCPIDYPVVNFLDIVLCEVHGHLWVGCPCSSWVWVSRASTRRCRLRPNGKTSLKSVRKANRLARRFCYAFFGYLFESSFMKPYAIERLICLFLGWNWPTRRAATGRLNNLPHPFSSGTLPSWSL